MAPYDFGTWQSYCYSIRALLTIHNTQWMLLQLLNEVAHKNDGGAIRRKETTADIKAAGVRAVDVHGFLLHLCDGAERGAVMTVGETDDVSCRRQQQSWVGVLRSHVGRRDAQHQLQRKHRRRRRRHLICLIKHRISSRSLTVQTGQPGIRAFAYSCPKTK